MSCCFFSGEPCITAKGWSKSLTLSKLKDMITIFLGSASGKYVPSKTYIFVKSCPHSIAKGHVFISGNGEHAEEHMLSRCGLPSSFFLTSAPCPDCAMLLFKAYEKEKTKPTIYIGRPYRGGGKSGKGNLENNMECQAMLVQAGFRLKPWDWDDIDDLLDDNECHKAIWKLQNKYGSVYDEKVKDTENALNKVIGMAMYKSKKKGYYEDRCKVILG